jgi:hypothetical protein
MKRLKIKALLSDPNISNCYKLGGRLDERFLAGVEYVQAIIENSQSIWAVREKWRDGYVDFFENEPKKNGDHYTAGQHCGFSTYGFHNATFENSPVEFKLIVDD